jgi:hypothetical protein
VKFCEVDDAEAGGSSGCRLEPAVEDTDVDGKLGNDCVSELDGS